MPLISQWGTARLLRLPFGVTVLGSEEARAQALLPGRRPHRRGQQLFAFWLMFVLPGA